jgi:Chlorophyll A-B binding protein
VRPKLPHLLTRDCHNLTRILNPGDYGFDPLGIANTKPKLKRMREIELKHARIAMLATVGWPISELFHSQVTPLNPDSTPDLSQLNLDFTPNLIQLNPDFTPDLSQLNLDFTPNLIQLDSDFTPDLSQLNPNSTPNLIQLDSDSTPDLSQLNPNSTPNS